MAKWGENDPRWIVQNRADGVNVNNWHWTESDSSGFAKNRLKELLENQIIETSIISTKLVDVTLEGEVSVNTRKQKTFLFYELNLTIKWTGTHTPTGVEGKGSVNAPYISEENDDDDFEVKVTIDDESKKEQTILKDEFRKKVIPLLKEKIPQMLKELRDATVNKTKLAPKEEPSAKLLDKVAPINFPVEKKVEVKTNVSSKTSFTITEKFMCSPQDLYDTLTAINRIRAYAGGDASLGVNPGDKFKLFGGSVEGEMVEAVMPKKIVQKWRFSSWPADHYSTVTMNIEEKNGKTILTLEQVGIPTEDKDRTEAGWRENFWRRIKGIFGYGPMY